MRQLNILLTLALLMVAFFSQCKAEIELEALPIGGNFSYTDKSGKKIKLSDYPEPVILVFFGYTQCPDFCPNVLSKIKLVKQKMGMGKEKTFRTVFISIDPARDDSSVVQKYIDFYLENASGLSFDLETTNKIVKQYAAYFEKAKDGEMIDHSTYVYVLDKDRKTRKLLRSSDPVDLFVEVIERLGENSI